jgi:hypothetical protein
MGSCILKPKVGEQTFEKLKEKIGYEDAMDIYTYALSDEFQNKYGHRLEYDDTNYPTFESLMDIGKVRNAVTLLESKQLTENSKSVEMSVNNLQSLLNTAEMFNENSDRMVASVMHADNGKIKIQYQPRTEQTIADASRQVAIMELAKQASEMLNTAGIKIEDLTDLDLMTGRVGVTEFKKAQDSLKNYEVLIRVANNLEGRKAVGEEFAHTILGIYHDDVLVQRSIKALMNERALREVMGDKYQAYYDYFQGDMELMAEEALGQILHEKMIESIEEGRKSVYEAKKGQNKPIIDRAYNKILSNFEGIDANEYHDAVTLVKKDMGVFAQEILKGNRTITQDKVEKAARVASFNALTGLAEKTMDTVRDAVKELGKVSALMDNLSTDEGKDSQKAKAYARFKEANAAITRQEKRDESVAAMVELVDAATQGLNEYYTQLQNIDELSKQDRFILLDNIKKYIMATNNILNDLNEVLTTKFYSDPTILAQKFATGNLQVDAAYIINSNYHMFNTDGKSASEIAQLIQQEGNKVKLDDSGEFYVNALTGQKHFRTTTAITAVPGVNPFDQTSPFYTPSTNIGTGIDEMNRALVDGKVIKRNGHWVMANTGTKVAEVFPNVTQQAADKYLDRFHDFIEEKRRQGITFLNGETVLDGFVDVVDFQGNVHQMAVAGTVDLIGHDNNGNWYIYDFKTHHGELRDDTKHKWQLQLTTYRNMLHQKYGVPKNKVKLGVIPIKVSYKSPFQVAYSQSQYAKHPEYPGKTNNQLVVGGQDFVGASPFMEQFIDISATDYQMDYGKLTGAVKKNNATTTGLEQLQAAVSLFTYASNKLKSDSQRENFKQLADILKVMFGDQMIVPDRNGKMENRTIEDILKHVDTDVGLVTSLTTSMADSTDVLLQMFDRIFKKANTQRRIRSIELSQRILAMGRKFENLGINNYDFMYEADNKNYIRKDFNLSAYRAAYNAEQERLDNIYGRGIIQDEKLAEQRRAEHKKWLEENTEVNAEGKTVPKKELYPAQYDSLTDTQKAFYDEWMAIKQEMDDLLPKNATRLRNTIKVRKQGWEKIKTSGIDVVAYLQRAMDNVINVVKESGELGTQAQDNELMKSDGIDVTLDLDNTPLKQLPMLYLNDFAHMEKDLSHDAIGTLIAYADMAINYDEMSQIVHPLNIAKEVLKQRTAGVSRAGKVLRAVIQTQGQTFTEDAVKNGEETSFYKQFNSFLESKIYGIKLKDAGAFNFRGKTIPLNVLFKKLFSLTSKAQLGFNALAQTSSAITGATMTAIEAAAGEYFGYQTLMKADKEFTKCLYDYVGDIGNRTQSSKLSLFMQYFNTKQNFDQIRHSNFFDQNKLTRIFGDHLMFIGQTAGDLWLYNRIAIAIALETKVMKDGVETNLWDAMELEDVDPNNPNAGKKLKLDGISIADPGVKDSDGKQVYNEWGVDNTVDFSERVIQLQHRLFGVYNDEDRVMARQYILGAALMQYRDWIPSQYKERFGKKRTDLSRGKDEFGNYQTAEGFYVTGWRFMRGVFGDVLKGQLNVVTQYKNLDKREKQAVRRMTREVGGFSLLCLLLAGLTKFGLGDDDDDRSLFMKHVIYLMSRQRTELGALLPGVNTKELLTLVDSPMAASSMLEQIGGIFELLALWNLGVEVEHGKYKGQSEWMKDWKKSIFYSWIKQYERVLDPTEATKRYQ